VKQATPCSKVADEAKMGKLEKAGFLVPGSREDLLGNTLVIIVPAKVQAAFEKYGFGCRNKPSGTLAEIQRSYA
jgi:ABC-type molybdate transport system substrate-binding protein